MGIKDEIKALQGNETSDVVRPPTDADVIVLFDLVPLFSKLFKPAQSTRDQEVKLVIYTKKAYNIPIRNTRFMAKMPTKGFSNALLETDEQPNQSSYLVTANEIEAADIKEKKTMCCAILH